MPLPIQNVTEAEWYEAPTVHRVLIGQARLAIRDHRPSHAIHEIMARMRRITAHTAQTMRARQVLTHLFLRRAGHDPVLQASATRMVVDHAKGGPLIHLLAWNDVRFVIASYDHGRHETYSLGRMEDGRYLWTDEMKLPDLAERLNREHIHGEDMAERTGL